jgi:hypothetical protein
MRRMQHSRPRPSNRTNRLNLKTKHIPLWDIDSQSLCERPELHLKSKLVAIIERVESVEVLDTMTAQKALKDLAISRTRNRTDILTQKKRIRELEILQFCVENVVRKHSFGAGFISAQK